MVAKYQPKIYLKGIVIWKRWCDDDNVISSFDQLIKEENGNSANTMFHDTLKVISKLPDRVSQEDSDGEDVIQNTSKNVFQIPG